MKDCSDIILCVETTELSKVRVTEGHSCKTKRPAPGWQCPVNTTASSQALKSLPSDGVLQSCF